MVDSASTTTHSVHGYRWGMWRASGRENGPLRYPVAEMEDLSGGGWIQRFQKGCTVVSRPRPGAASCTTTRGWPGSRSAARGARSATPRRPRRPARGYHPALPARRAVGPRLPPDVRGLGRGARRLAEQRAGPAAAMGSRPRTSSTTATARTPACSRAARSPPERHRHAPAAAGPRVRRRTDKRAVRGCGHAR